MNFYLLIIFYNAYCLGSWGGWSQSQLTLDARRVHPDEIANIALLEPPADFGLHPFTASWPT